MAEAQTRPGTGHAEIRGGHVAVADIAAAVGLAMGVTPSEPRSGSGPPARGGDSGQGSAGGSEPGPVGGEDGS